MNFFEFAPMVQEEMSYKDISYLELWQPFVQQRGIICAILEEGSMESQSQNPEFRSNPDNFHPCGYWLIKSVKDICGYFQCAPFPPLQKGIVVWVLSFDP